MTHRGEESMCWSEEDGREDNIHATNFLEGVA
jgi:hypothetical protein